MKQKIVFIFNGRIIRKHQFLNNFCVVFLVCVFFGALAISCDQEPLFYDIATEYPPIDPLVQGSPSKIVAITLSNSPWKGTLYVSNRERIWEYSSGDPVWKKTSAAFPGGLTIDIAAAGNTLYALNQEGKIWSFNNTAWSPVTIAGVRGKIDCIFGADSFLFAGALIGSSGGGTSYDIYIIDNTNTIVGKKQDTARLMGAALLGAGNYYLGTMGDGLYVSVNGANPAPVSGYEKEEIIGLTVCDNKLYSVHPGKIRCLGVTSNVATGRFSSGIAGWTNGTDHLLLVGLNRTNGTFGYGYREIKISGGFPVSLSIPGANEPTSVDTRSQYTSAIGKHAVNHIWVVEGSNGDGEGRPVIFASTAKDGLWSYRVRDGNAQWNGE